MKVEIGTQAESNEEKSTTSLNENLPAHNTNPKTNVKPGEINHIDLAMNEVLNIQAKTIKIDPETARRLLEIHVKVYQCKNA